MTVRLVDHDGTGRTTALLRRTVAAHGGLRTPGARSRGTLMSGMDWEPPDGPVRTIDATMDTGLVPTRDPDGGAPTLGAVVGPWLADAVDAGPDHQSDLIAAIAALAADVDQDAIVIDVRNPGPLGRALVLTLGGGSPHHVPIVGDARIDALAAALDPMVDLRAHRAVHAPGARHVLELMPRTTTIDTTDDPVAYMRGIASAMAMLERIQREGGR